MAFTKVVGAGIHTLSNITSHNVHSSGIITATKFDGPFDNINVSGAATFTGNVTIGGTLTYEDVTNIDSVGLVTAREGIFLPDNKSVKFGNTAASPNFQIFHNTSGDYNEIKGNTGNLRIRNHDTSGSGKSLYIQSEIIQLRSHTNNHPMVDARAGAQVDLYFNNEKKLETSAKGIKVGTGVTVETSGQATFTGIVTATSFKLANGNDVGVGAGGTWGTYTAGIATSKSVGVNTNTLDDNDLVGVGNSFQGMYISNGMMITDNTLNGNHYIGTAFYGLMAGPVTIDGTLTIDGNYVVV